MCYFINIFNIFVAIFMLKYTRRKTLMYFCLDASTGRIFINFHLGNNQNSRSAFEI